MAIKVLLVAGARPNFMKVAPILEEMRRYPKTFWPLFVHTGQHYDEEMSRVFIGDLGLPEPDIYLGVGSGSHAVQTAKVMVEFEKVVLREKPDLVLVVGDVNSTLACALVAAKLNVPVAHVEAGLRSFDRTMPEEINRILTDHLSELLFTTCEEAGRNLRREGIPEQKIHFVGNVMIHTLIKCRERAQSSDILDKLNLKPKEYCLLTLHRPSNVDRRKVFEGILKALDEIQNHIKLVFPVHPRTYGAIEKFGLREWLSNMKNLQLISPIGYIHFLKLQENARFVITDSGGVQEETTFLNVPCLTVRENTERPVTITWGTNVLVGTSPACIVKESLRILIGNGKKGNIPPLWDGQVAQRIVSILQQKVSNSMATEKLCLECGM